MIHIVLYQPEIPPNTSNIIRLCANSGASLHLIHPLGFELDNTKLQRAGLDYHEWADVMEYKSIDNYLHTAHPDHLYAVSTRGQRNYNDVTYSENTALLFGPETRGLPKSVLDTFAENKILRIPMQSESRSLNLSNSVAIILYEAWRQLGFK